LSEAVAELHNIDVDLFKSTQPFVELLDFSKFSATLPSLDVEFAIAGESVSATIIATEIATKVQEQATTGLVKAIEENPAVESVDQIPGFYESDPESNLPTDSE